MNNDQFYNRDLSWLRFNHRVLQEAKDERNPLFERIKFLAIFSSNLDEFFKVRVSEIRQIKGFDKNLRKKLINKPNKLLKTILADVGEMQEEFGRVWTEDIRPELAEYGISFATVNQMNNEQIEFARNYFSVELEQKLTIKKGFNNHEDTLFVENEELYCFAKLENELFFAKFPDSKRFIELPSAENKHVFCYIDDILKLGLKELYNTDFYTLKVSRDAELYIEDEVHGTLVDKIDEALANRETGQITRMLIERGTPAILMTMLSNSFDVNETDMILGGDYHNFSDFFGFPNPIGDNITFKPMPPLQTRTLTKYDSILKAIKERDRVFYFPYESFDSVIRLVNEAVNDEFVRKIKITLYRVSKDSAIGNLLLKALENGKKVVVFIETKARFDEANNLKWGKILEENGAKVIYSLPAIKVHSKILLIERQIEDEIEKYAYIGTGNFNEKTAKIYTDFGLMTANETLTQDISQVFWLLESRIIYPKTKLALVSPFSARNRFEELIRHEIEHAKAGKPAYIILKLNSLQDKQMIKLFYKASNAGVKIQLIIRGLCCLIPGIKDQSENIQITSIVGRYLEHARVYIFGNNGNEKVYIGSADWMTRNLDHRIEVIAPLENKTTRKIVRSIIDIQLNDNQKARIIDAKQLNYYVENDEPPCLAQNKIYKYLKGDM